MDNGEHTSSYLPLWYRSWRKPVMSHVPSLSTLLESVCLKQLECLLLDSFPAIEHPTEKTSKEKQRQIDGHHYHMKGQERREKS